MKLFFFILATFLSVVGFAQTDSNGFYIRVEEWNAWNNNIYIFTDSNVKIDRVCSLVDRNDCFSGSPSAKSVTNLVNYLSNIKLDSVKEKYSNGNVDDNLEYNFDIVFGGRKIRKHIYMSEYLEYLDLVEMLNTMIPSYFAIGYNYNYIHGKLKGLQE